MSAKFIFANPVELGNRLLSGPGAGGAVKTCPPRAGVPIFLDGCA
jgi:hypothetical protein